LNFDARALARDGVSRLRRSYIGALQKLHVGKPEKHVN
jgi:hypothetical protein